MITETWLHDAIDDADIFPPSYKVFRRDRPTRGGGVAVLVKNTISAFLTRQIDNHESVTLKVSCWERSFMLFAVYRAPDSPSVFLRQLCEHVASFKNGKYILAGDFNLPGVDWNQPFSNREMSSHVAYLTDIMLTADVQQVVDQPTRIHGNCASTLDLIFISRCIKDYSVSVQPGLSDHEMVLLSCSLGACKTSLLFL